MAYFLGPFFPVAQPRCRPGVLNKHAEARNETWCRTSVLQLSMCASTSLNRQTEGLLPASFTNSLHKVNYFVYRKKNHVFNTCIYYCCEVIMLQLNTMQGQSILEELKVGFCCNCISRRWKSTNRCSRWRRFYRGFGELWAACPATRWRCRLTSTQIRNQIFSRYTPTTFLSPGENLACTSMNASLSSQLKTTSH